MKKRTHITPFPVLLMIGVLFYAISFMLPHPSAAAPTMLEVYPDFAEEILQSAQLVKLEDGLLIKARNFEIRGSFAEKMLKQLPPGLQAELEKNLLLLLNQETIEAVIRHDAAAMGIDIDVIDDQSIQPYVDRVTEGVTVTDKEVKTFYDENQVMVGGIPFDQLKDSIKEMILQQKKQGILKVHIMDVAKKSEMKINQDWVKEQVTKSRDNPLDRARMSGKPTLAQFSSPGCPPCQMMKPILAKIKKSYAKKVNVVVITAGENQMLAQRFGVRAVPVQVLFDKDGKKVFQHTGFLSEPDIMKQLKKLGISS